MFYNYLIFNMVTLSLRILLKYCVSHRGTVCFIKENTLFLLTKHLVLLHKNKMFLYTETTCFPMLKQSVQCCELMN